MLQIRLFTLISILYLISVSNANLYEDFSNYTIDNWREGTLHGNYRCIFTGYGQVGIQEFNDTKKVLFEIPNTAISSASTHASLAVGNDIMHNFELVTHIRTVRQLRSNANPWEVAWVVWHYSYSDNFHSFYYFILKPNGFELGKTDDNYVNNGLQRFLRTGSTPQFPVDKLYKVKVKQIDNEISVWVDDNLLVNKFRDNERPYLEGPIGFYNEDSHIQVFDVNLVSLESSETPLNAN